MGEIKGTVIEVSPVEVITSKADASKQWNKSTFAIKETEGDYPKEIAFDLFGKKCDELRSQLSVGSVVTVSYNLKSTKSNNRWFTVADCWRFNVDIPVGNQSGSSFPEDEDPLPF